MCLCFKRSRYCIAVPKINDENYIQTLKSIIAQYSINLVIPLNDLELPILSKHKNRLEGPNTTVVVSELPMTTMAFDKWKTYQFLVAHHIKTPKTFLNIKSTLEAMTTKEIKYPLIVKPRWGTGSIGIEVAENEEQLHLFHKTLSIKIKRSILRDIGNLEETIIIQEKIEGDEYGMDILNDLNGNYYGSFAKKKLSMRSGETDKAISVIEERFSDFGKRVGSLTGHTGIMDCDFFVTPTNEIYFLEMNPRFGGGYPFSHEAGANVAKIYILWAMGEKKVSHFNRYKAGLIFSKYDQIIQINREHKNNAQL
jgi:carbamoyl-phosphate synthase large subunit